MDLIRVDGLVCGFPDRPVLRELSFSVQEGDFIGVIGPNGAGKTTLTRVLAGILRPAAGKIFYRERELAAIPPSVLAREMALLPSALDLHFPYSVNEFVSMGRFPFIGRFGRFSDRDLEIITRCLRWLDIERIRERRMNEISDGERQRVCLAQTLAQEPRFIILDEPTSHLDIGHQYAILDLLKEVNLRRQLSILAVFHELNIASEYCGTILLLRDGRLAGMGRPDEVLRPDKIREAYGTDVAVFTNPVTGRPFLSRVGKENKGSGDSNCSDR